MRKNVTATAMPTDKAMSRRVAREMRVPRDTLRRLGLVVAVTAGAEVGLTGLVQVRRDAGPHGWDGSGDRQGRRLQCLRRLSLRQREGDRPRVGLLVPD